MERTPSPAVLGPMANPWLDLDLMGTLKRYGMHSACEEVIAAGIKRQHEPPRIVGDLLQSEIAEKQARSTLASSYHPSANAAGQWTPDDGH